MTAPAHLHGIQDVRALEARPYAEFMPHASVPAALAASAARWPQQVALRYIVDAELATPPQDTTYADLLAAVHRAGHLFTALAAPERPRVALLLPAIPQAQVALWAAESVGLACPLNYLLQPDHLVHLVQSAGCNVLVALAPGQGLDLAERVAALQAQCPALRQVLWVGPGLAADLDFDALCATQPADAPPAARTAQPDDVVALFHTGGTTGAPKLAQHTHRNQLHSARGAALMYGTTPDDRIVNGLPLFHVAGSLVFGLSTLLAGGTIILPTLLGMRNTGYMGRYWAFAARERATLVTATPTGIATLMAAPREGLDLSSVRALLTGGAPLPTGLADAFERDFGMPVRNTLGMTECAGVISIEPVAAPRVPGSCGLRLPYLTVAFDAHDASRRDGVLRLRGPNVSPGYTEAERNAGMFEDGWLVSGDLARIDDDERLYVTGRAKDLIIRNSHNIDPQVIEEALMRHPEVAMAAAVGEPDAYAGELPVAFVVLHPGSTADAAAILHFIAPLIAERPAFPKRLEVLPALPQTAVGKVYKPALRLRAIEQALARQLEAAGLAGAVSVQGEEREGLLAVCFTAAAHHEAALAELMRPYALTWRRVPPEVAS